MTKWVTSKKLLDDLNKGRRVGNNGTRVRFRQSAFWDSLRAHPGKWAEYPGVGQINSNYKPGFEVTHRGGKQYVRYIGE